MSTTQAPPKKLSSSYIDFLDRVTAKGFHFKKQNPNGLWSSIPRCSDLHKIKVKDLESTILELQKRDK